MEPEAGRSNNRVAFADGETRPPDKRPDCRPPILFRALRRTRGNIEAVAMSALPPTAHIGLNGTNLWNVRARILELMMMGQFSTGVDS